MRPILTLCLLFCLGSCGKVASPSSKQQLNLAIYSDPASLDPRKVNFSKDLSVAKELYEGLFRLDHSGKVVPALAKETHLSDDGSTYTFYLRESCWSNGEKVTAYDFERSWHELLSPDFPSDSFNLLYPIKNAKAFKAGNPVTLGVKAVDAKTLRVELEQPTTYFLELLSFPISFPVHPASSDTQAITNGPFSILSWSPQRELLLEKNPLYWDAPHVNLDRLRYLIVDQESTVSYLFEKGEIDWLGPPLTKEIPSETLNALKKRDSIRSYPVLGTLWLQFNTKKAPLQEVAMRKALGYCISRQEMISQILEGDQTVATSILPPPHRFEPNPLFQG